MSDYNDFLGQVQMRLIEMGYLPPLWPTEEDPVESAAQMIAGLMDGWISVEDRLPEFSMFVDVWVKSTEREDYGRRICSVLLEHSADDLHPAEYVSHWMPLPEPPKERG